jgi:hypothetical protein
MRKLVSLATLLLALLFLAASAQESQSGSSTQLQIDSEHQKWIEHVMRSIAGLKPGMTRKDLSEIFGEEGGLSTRTQRRYVYKHCPYIKVDVEFSVAEGVAEASRNAFEESPNDKIVKISRPYLEFTISD